MQWLQDMVSILPNPLLFSEHDVLKKLKVNTDQTRHMDKSIIKHQADNVPLRRFGEVCTVFSI